MSQAVPPIEGLLGSQICVTTTFGEEIKGELFCVDIAGSNSVVICQRLPGGAVNFRWIKTNIIREVSAAAGPRAAAAEEWLPHVDLHQAEGRAKKAEDDAREEKRHSS